MTSKSDAYNQWKNLFDKDVLKDSINKISMFITVYELLEDTIISKPRDFYTVLEFDENAQKEYDEKVLSLYD